MKSEYSQITLAILIALCAIKPAATNADVIPTGTRSIRWKGIFVGQTEFEAQYDFYYALIDALNETVLFVEPAPNGYVFHRPYWTEQGLFLATPKGQMSSEKIMNILKEGGAAALKNIPGVHVSEPFTFATPTADSYVEKKSPIRWVVEQYSIKSIGVKIVFDHDVTSNVSSFVLPLAGASSLGLLLLIALFLKKRQRNKASKNALQI